MNLCIQPYTEDLAAAVAAFNQRISRANPPFLLPETAVPQLPGGQAPGGAAPGVREPKVHHETFLAVENGAVRGAYTLRHQEFSFHGRTRRAAACLMLISEGIADRRYSIVGPGILRDALSRQPLLFGLGIGSVDASIARLERAMGWSLRIVPFYFKIRHGFQFFRNIEYLRTSRARRWLFDTVAYTGLASLAARAAAAVLTASRSRQPAVTGEQVAAFSAWADAIWHACHGRYSMTAVLDAETLNSLYPPDDMRFIRLKVREGSRVVGWAVLLDTAMSNHKHFGNMRVGTLVDCLAEPEDAEKVIVAATSLLEQRGVDLLVSNQSHPAWCRALRFAGYVPGPSNFILTMSQELTRLVDEIDPAGAGIRVNRGDGDGPIHL